MKGKYSINSHMAKANTSLVMVHITRASFRIVSFMDKANLLTFLMRSKSVVSSVKEYIMEE